MARRRRYSGCDARSIDDARSALVGSLIHHLPGRVLFFAFQLGLHLRRLQRLHHRLQIGLLVEIGLGVELVLDVGQDLHHARIAHPPLQAPEHLLKFVERHQEIAQLGAFQTVVPPLQSPPSGSRWRGAGSRA